MSNELEEQKQWNALYAAIRKFPKPLLVHVVADLCATSGACNSCDDPLEVTRVFMEAVEAVLESRGTAPVGELSIPAGESPLQKAFERRRNRNADRVDGYDRDDTGESPDY